MASVHVQATTQVHSSDVPADFIVNNLYAITNATPSAQDYQDVAQHFSDALYSTVGFGGAQPWTLYAGRYGTVKVYDLADPKPRPERGMVHYVPQNPEIGNLGPRGLSVCLSYYSGRNLPHSRGRIYLGPFTGGQVLETPQASLLGAIMDLAKGLEGIALKPSISWNHAVHSTVTGLTQVVSNWWAHDLWSFVHSREHVESLRVKFPQIGVPSGVYTTRFVFGQFSTGTHSFVVPAGKRAIVRHADFAQAGGGTSSMYMGIAGVNFWAGNQPGGYSDITWDGIAVAMAGESIYVVVTAGTVNVSVCGYLFDDP